MSYSHIRCDRNVIMVAMSYICRQNVSQISLEIVVNCLHPSEILALASDPDVISQITAFHQNASGYGQVSPLNIYSYKKAERQSKQSHQLFLPSQDDCKTRIDIK